jgi:putative tryptophan/tyrosine transport system substrate-binding protein
MIFSAVFFGSRLEQLAMLAARHRVLARATNFANYSRGPDELRNKPDRTHRQAGVYAGRILKGEKPADLPVVQSSKFELVINVQTARTLGLDVPPRCSRSPTR